MATSASLSWLRDCAGLSYKPPFKLEAVALRWRSASNDKDEEGLATDTRPPPSSSSAAGEEEEEPQVVDLPLQLDGGVLRRQFANPAAEAEFERFVDSSDETARLVVIGWLLQATVWTFALTSSLDSVQATTHQKTFVPIALAAMVLLNTGLVMFLTVCRRRCEKQEGDLAGPQQAYRHRLESFRTRCRAVYIVTFLTSLTLAIGARSEVLIPFDSARPASDRWASLTFFDANPFVVMVLMLRTRAVVIVMGLVLFVVRMATIAFHFYTTDSIASSSDGTNVHVALAIRAVLVFIVLVLWVTIAVSEDNANRRHFLVIVEAYVASERLVSKHETLSVVIRAMLPRAVADIVASVPGISKNANHQLQDDDAQAVTATNNDSSSGGGLNDDGYGIGRLHTLAIGGGSRDDSDEDGDEGDSMSLSRSGRASSASGRPDGRRQPHEQQQPPSVSLPASLKRIRDQSHRASIVVTEIADFALFERNCTTVRAPVAALARLFTLLDVGTALFNVDRAATYGDAYIVTAGLVRGSTATALQLVRYALWQLEVQQSGHLILHACVTTGELSAGVVGSTYGALRYRVSGDALARALSQVKAVPRHEVWACRETRDCVRRELAGDAPSLALGLPTLSPTFNADVEEDEFEPMRAHEVAPLTESMGAPTASDGPHTPQEQALSTPVSALDAEALEAHHRATTTTPRASAPPRRMPSFDGAQSQTSTQAAALTRLALRSRTSRLPDTPSGVAGVRPLRSFSSPPVARPTSQSPDEVVDGNKPPPAAAAEDRDPSSVTFGCFDNRGLEAQYRRASTGGYALRVFAVMAGIVAVLFAAFDWLDSEPCLYETSWAGFAQRVTPQAVVLPLCAVTGMVAKPRNHVLGTGSIRASALRRAFIARCLFAAVIISFNVWLWLVPGSLVRNSPLALTTCLMPAVVTQLLRHFPWYVQWIGGVALFLSPIFTFGVNVDTLIMSSTLVNFALIYSYHFSGASRRRFAARFVAEHRLTQLAAVTERLAQLCNGLMPAHVVADGLSEALAEGVRNRVEHAPEEAGRGIADDVTEVDNDVDVRHAVSALNAVLFRGDFGDDPVDEIELMAVSAVTVIPIPGHPQLRHIAPHASPLDSVWECIEASLNAANASTLRRRRRRNVLQVPLNALGADSSSLSETPPSTLQVASSSPPATTPTPTTTGSGGNVNGSPVPNPLMGMFSGFEEVESDDEEVDGAAMPDRQPPSPPRRNEVNVAMEQGSDYDHDAYGLPAGRGHDRCCVGDLTGFEPEAAHVRVLRALHDTFVIGGPLYERAHREAPAIAAANIARFIHELVPRLQQVGFTAAFGVATEEAAGALVGRGTMRYAVGGPAVRCARGLCGAAALRVQASLAFGNGATELPRAVVMMSDHVWHQLRVAARLQLVHRGGVVDPAVLFFATPEARDAALANTRSGSDAISRVGLRRSLVYLL